MNRRPFALAASTLAATLVLATPPAPARADGITPNTPGTATYELTASQAIPAPDPNASGPQVIAQVVPPGTVIPPTNADGSQGSPLTILRSSTGFDQSQLIVALKDNLSNTPAGVTPQQLFGLSFFGGGLAQNGHLDFSLSVDKSVTTPPVLQSLTPGVTITALQTVTPSTGSSGTTSTSTSSSSSPVTATIPEPVSVVLWSALAGVGLLRARAYRRRGA